MSQSAGCLRSPGLLRHPPVDAFEQIAELRRRYCHRSVGWLRPYEATPLQPLGKQAHALPVMPQHLDQPATAATKHEQMPAVWVTLERLLHQQRQAIKPLAHVGVASRQPNPCTTWGRDHRRRLLFASAFISADTVEASTDPDIRIRPPPANSISMTPAVFGSTGEAASRSGLTTTGSNTAGICVRSQSCWRQRNNWLA